jgi:hypothetical protein
MSDLPAGLRVAFADEVPDMPQICNLPGHGPYAHKHAGIGKTWFYRPAPSGEAAEPTPEAAADREGGDHA